MRYGAYGGENRAPAPLQQPLNPFDRRRRRPHTDRRGSKTAHIEPGSPWENGHCESFNSKLRDKLLKNEIFYGLTETRAPIEPWSVHADTVRAHSALGYRPAGARGIIPRNGSITPWARALAVGPRARRPQLSQAVRCTNIQPGPPRGGRPEPPIGSETDLVTVGR